MPDKKIKHAKKTRGSNNNQKKHSFVKNKKCYIHPTLTAGVSIALLFSIIWLFGLIAGGMSDSSGIIPQPTNAVQAPLLQQTPEAQIHPSTALPPITATPTASPHKTPTAEPTVIHSPHPVLTPLPENSDIIGYSLMQMPGAAALPDAQKTYIAFVFEGSSVSHYDIAFDIMDGKKIPGSIIIDTHLIGGEGYLGWDMVAQLHSAGWSVGSISGTEYETRMAPEALSRRLAQINDDFIKNKLMPPRIHAYAFGKYNDDVMRIIAPYRTFAIAAFIDDEYFNFADINPYAVPAASGEMPVEELYQSRISLVDSAVAADGAFIILRFGHIGDDFDQSQWQITTKPEYFTKLIDYCIEKHCEIITLDELEAMIKSSHINTAEDNDI